MPVELITKRRFIFSAGAVAFGGRMQRSGSSNLKAAAPSELPETGGISETLVTGHAAHPFHIDKFVTFREAYSIVQGDFPDQPDNVAAVSHFDDSRYRAHTVAHSRLTHFQIDTSAHHAGQAPFHVFKAEHLELKFESFTDWTSAPVYDRVFEPTYREVSLTVEGGRKYILDVAITPDLLSGNVTKTSLLQRYATDAAFRQRYAHCFDPYRDQSDPPVPLIPIPTFTSPRVVLTFIQSLSWRGGEEPPHTSITANQLTIAGLGTLYFGEIILEQENIRPNLLRCELDSNAQRSGQPGHKGNLKVVELRTNGSPWPPNL